MKSLIVVHSYHHNNTLKVSEAIASELGSDILATSQAKSDILNDYDMIGFGAGIDSGMHYKELLYFATTIEDTNCKKPCFIFSTSAVQGKRKIFKDHAKLRGILTGKGYLVIAEFSCKGFNTNSILKYIGGMNKKHPNETDIIKAKRFAHDLLLNTDIN